MDELERLSQRDDSGQDLAIYKTTLFYVADEKVEVHIYGIQCIISKVQCGFLLNDKINEKINNAISTLSHMEEVTNNLLFQEHISI